MKHSSPYILILFLILTGCSGASPSLEVATQFASPTRSVTQTITPEVTLTPSLSLTATPVPTRTVTYTPTQTLHPTITPTYDPASARTITPVPAAACPAVNQSYQPVFADQVVNGFWYLHDLSGPILDALNQGAGLTALKHAVSRATYDGEPANISPEAIFEKDVTGDGVPEVIFDSNWLIIYTCQDSKFKEVLKWNSGLETFVEKPIIVDMNMDGLAEIVAPAVFRANFVIEYTFNIMRWDGTNFAIMVPEQDITFNGVMKWSVRDTNRNGTLELIIRNWPPTSPDADLHGPWRYENYTYSWNGITFVRLPTVFDPPEYRFQAIQDGDRAMRCCDFRKAINFYNQAIDDPYLKGWGYSLEHFMQRQKAQSDFYMHTPTPTPLPLDPNEIPNLKAYARYRILLAHVMIHEDGLAKADY